MIAATPLTAGQIRRRWRARAVAAAHAVPFWIVLMASLLVNDKKIMRRDKKLVDNNCTDCCGTPGCSDCPGHACDQCTVGASPQTPSQWHVTVSGVDTLASCLTCDPVYTGYPAYMSGDGVSHNGTYTLNVQIGFAPHACSWEYTNAGGPSLTGGPNPDCSSPYDTETGFGLVINKTAGGMSLDGDGPTVIYGLRTGVFFRGVVTTGDCCSPHTFTNEFTAFTCDGGPSHDLRYGINGTAVATPC